MKIAFYGSSLVSSYWNGAATYYRGIIRELARRGYDVTFYEPDAYERQAHRDIDPPDWCRVVVYPATVEHMKRVVARAGEADIVVKASGVGVFDDELLEGVMRAARPDAIRIFWDVDAAATVAELRSDPDHPLHAELPQLNAVLTYGGGPPIVTAYRVLGARDCRPIYNALDPDTHHPVQPDAKFSCDLAFLANRLPDRERRVEDFFLSAAEQLPEGSFLLGGAGWEDKPKPANVRYIGHVPTRDHNAFNCTPLAVLNVARDSMASIGYSPATRVFEAAGAAACIVTDAWDGVELFLQPGREILVARDGKDVAALVRELTPGRATEIGRRALARILREHTYAHRGAEVDAFFRKTREAGRVMTSAGSKPAIAEGVS
ncbi:MAG: glycosyltransferase [Methylobacteriaceae bacterium]|nr:glycosyltransferase [Methylobacteriaceae bacterium]